MKNLSLFCLLAFFITACSESNPNPDNNNNNSTDFVAEAKDFANFRTWTKVISLSQAHSDDGRAHTNAARVVYINNAAAKRNAQNQYDKGTIVVKEVEGGYGVVAMVKRGGSFNPNHQNWEWFQLETNGGIKSRSASDGCNSCHSKAKSLDYVFTKP